MYVGSTFKNMPLCVPEYVFILFLHAELKGRSTDTLLDNINAFAICSKKDLLSKAF